MREAVIIYVDDFFIRASAPYRGTHITDDWCHMQADTREEVDALARTRGRSLSWIQRPDSPAHRHYDVTRSRRAAAIQAGAIPVTMRELSAKRAEWRAEHQAQQEGQVER